ncbi:PKD domain-containing protein [Candidatus Pacearchaeota archaeon]|nr:PKD domain-containing protein [Candidatus Pacearchaeota archaeon]
MKKGFVFLIVFSILIVSVVSADYSIDDNYLIEQSYGPGDTLKGWINISLTNEWANSTFESSEGDTATLITLVDADEDFLHTCDTLLCLSNYDATGQDTTKTFPLDAGESALFGFKILGNKIADVSDFSLDIESDSELSDISQLKIDVLNNEEKIWKAHNASTYFGEGIYGCYISAENQVEIIPTPYCQRITIPPAPNIEIWAKLIGSGTENVIIMSVKSMDGQEYGECEILASAGSVSCEPTGFIVEKEQNYFVCIEAKTSEEDKYYINSETNTPCGFVGSFNDEYEMDFEIFVKPGIYGAVGGFTLNETEISYIEIYIADYLEKTYYNDCPSEGCIVPIKITSMVDDQTITIPTAELTYSNYGAPSTTYNLYDLTETPAKISADMQKLSIDAGGFTVPSDYDEHTISLSFKDYEIFSEKITVEKVPIIKFLDPITTAKSYPTTFTVKVDSDKQIKLYEWDFGNGDAEITLTNKVTYTYNVIGTHELEVRVIDVDNRSSSKIFTITVGSAAEITGILLQKNKINLGIIKNQIKDFSGFEQEILKETLNIDAIKTVLDSAQIANAAASSEEDYQAVLKDLLEMRVPQMISLSASADSIIFYPEKTNINIDVLTEIAGGDYESSKENKYINAVLGWNVKNVDITVTYREITSSFEDHDELLLNTFKVDVTKKAGCEEDPYIILKKVDGLIFAEDYSEDEKLGYFYIPLVEESKKIVFATTEDINFIDLPLFVSPSVNKLSLVDFDISPIDDYGKLKKWALFVLIILLLIIIGIIFWIVLHAWYKKKYEDYLFKNKNNLYNLFTWIGNAKKRGLNENKIKSQLRKAGWTSEQLRYALRKHSGKRTGMPGIPIRKIIKRSVPQGKFPGNQQPRNELR